MVVVVVVVAAAAVAVSVVVVIVAVVVVVLQKLRVLSWFSKASGFLRCLVQLANNIVRGDGSATFKVQRPN